MNSRMILAPQPSTDRRARRPSQDTLQSPLDTPFPLNHRLTLPSRSITVVSRDNPRPPIRCQSSAARTIVSLAWLRIPGSCASSYWTDCRCGSQGDERTNPPFPGGRPMVPTDRNPTCGSCREARQGLRRRQTSMHACRPIDRARHPCEPAFSTTTVHMSAHNQEQTLS